MNLNNGDSQLWTSQNKLLKSQKSQNDTIQNTFYIAKVKNITISDFG